MGEREQMIYQEITYDFIDKLNACGITLSQLEELMNLYNRLPEQDRLLMWRAENDIIRREQLILKKRESVSK